jgi:hypothetical protein
MVFVESEEMQDPVDIAIAKCIDVMMCALSELLTSGEEIAVKLKSTQDQQQQIVDLIKGLGYSL